MDWIKIFDQEFVRDFLKKVFKHSFNATQSVYDYKFKSGSTQDEFNLLEERWFRVLNFFVFFYLFLTERFAYGHLSDELNEEFIPALEDVILGFTVDIIYGDLNLNQREKINLDSQKRFQKFQRVFDDFTKLLPGEENNPEDTFFFNFIKVMANEFKLGEDPGFIKVMKTQLIQSMLDIDYNSFIHKVRDLKTSS